MSSNVNSAAVRQSPYKLLNYFEIQDANIFFGRSAEIDRLGALVQSNRLTLLYGASGAGKTSLVLAGVIPYLSEIGYDFIYVRALQEPARAIRNALARQVQRQISAAQILDSQEQEILPRLRQMIVEHFDLEDLRDLCFELQIRFDDISGSTRSGKARELITFCHRNGRLPHLLNACHRLRPNGTWMDDLPEAKIEPVATFHDLWHQDGPLTDLIQAATRILSGTLVVLLDQFEEFFIRINPQDRATFIDELGSLYDAQDIPIRIVLSLRADWLAFIGELEKRIPEVFNNRFWLLPLNREQAREAVEEPAQKAGVVYKQDLTERLLDDLIGDGETAVMPPELQIVCSALFNNLAPQDKVITLTSYDNLGGAKGVLQNYLQEALTPFSLPERNMALEILMDGLVTSRGTKAVKTAAELARSMNVPVEELTHLLERLVRARLVRVQQHEKENQFAYELAHEYLIQDIQQSQETLARKEAEELLKQEVDHWNRHATLIPADKLALIEESRVLLRPSPEANELLLRSALQVEGADLYWLGRMADEEQKAKVLLESAGDSQTNVRLRAAVGLAHTVVDAQRPAELIHSLLQLAITDADGLVQKTARAGLSGLVQYDHLHEVVKQEIQGMATHIQEKNDRKKLLSLLGQIQLPLVTWPTSIRKKFMATWLGDWLKMSLIAWFFGLFFAGMIFAGIRWLLERLSLPPDALQDPIYDVLGLSWLILIAGFYMAYMQKSLLQPLILPPSLWLITNIPAWAAGGILAAVMLKTEWPGRLFASEAFSEVALVAAVGLGIGFIVSTAQGLAIRRQGYRYALWRLWLWTLVFPAILSAAWLVVAPMTVAEQPLVLILASFIIGTAVGILPAAAVGLWLDYYMKRDWE